MLFSLLLLITCGLAGFAIITPGPVRTFFIKRLVDLASVIETLLRMSKKKLELSAGIVSTSPSAGNNAATSQPPSEESHDSRSSSTKHADGTSGAAFLDSIDSLSSVSSISSAAGHPSKMFPGTGPAWGNDSSSTPASADLIDTSYSLQLQMSITRPISSGNVLDPAKFNKFVLVKTTRLNHDTAKLRFAIPGNECLDIPIGRHICIRAEIAGLTVHRAYTPVTTPDQQGYFELVVKSYEFGKMSSFLHELTVGDEIEARGPVGTFSYKANAFNHICLIAAGSGLTPCLQILTSVLEMEDFQNDRTQFTLLYQNRTERDILLLQELRTLHQRFNNRVTMAFFVSSPVMPSWGEKVGQVRGCIDADVILSLDPRPGLVCICGPSGFNAAMDTACREASFDSRSIYIF
jgi:cytochrome-b5 reductase